MIARTGQETVIGRVLPPGVAHASVRGDPANVESYRAEEFVTRLAVPERQREFRTVRHCARIALAQLGRPPVALLPGPTGATHWPAGTTGSMTHCAGYRAAAVAETDHFVSVGIDAEPHQCISDDALQAIALPQERAMLIALYRTNAAICWDRLLFSAKESIFKAWSPLTGKRLGFDGALVRIDPIAHTFRARLLVPGPFLAGNELTGFSGRWAVGQGVVVTAIAVRGTGQLPAWSDSSTRRMPSSKSTFGS